MELRESGNRQLPAYGVPLLSLFIPFPSSFPALRGVTEGPSSFSFFPLLFFFTLYFEIILNSQDSFPGSSAGKESSCNAGDLG